MPRCRGMRSSRAQWRCFAIVAAPGTVALLTATPSRGSALARTLAAMTAIQLSIVPTLVPAPAPTAMSLFVILLQVATDPYGRSVAEPSVYDEYTTAAVILFLDTSLGVAVATFYRGDILASRFQVAPRVTVIDAAATARCSAVRRPRCTCNRHRPHYCACRVCRHRDLGGVHPVGDRDCNSIVSIIQKGR